MSKEDIIRIALDADLDVFGGDVIKKLERFHTITRNATLDEIATKIAAMPFGDTAASFAVWIREQKT